MVPSAAAGWLYPAVPNPFNPATRLDFALAKAGSVELAIFDLNGRRVRTLISAHLDAGDHRRIWDGRAEDGRLAASGVYLYQLRGQGFVESRRVVLLK